MSKDFEQWVRIKNIIAHKVCFGLHDDKTHIMFGTGAYIKQSRDEIKMIGVAVMDFKRCTLFAAGLAHQIMSQMPEPKLAHSE